MFLKKNVWLVEPTDKKTGLYIYRVPPQLKNAEIFGSYEPIERMIDVHAMLLHYMYFRIISNNY